MILNQSRHRGGTLESSHNQIRIPGQGGNRNSMSRGPDYQSDRGKIAVITLGLD